MNQLCSVVRDCLRTWVCVCVFLCQYKVVNILLVLRYCPLDFTKGVCEIRLFYSASAQDNFLLVGFRCDFCLNAEIVDAEKTILLPVKNQYSLPCSSRSWFSSKAIDGILGWKTVFLIQKLNRILFRSLKQSIVGNISDSSSVL